MVLDNSAKKQGKRKKLDPNWEARSERVCYVIRKREMAELDRLRGIEDRNDFARKILLKTLKDQSAGGEGENG